jgi:chemotaxis-related protein WspD
VSGKAPKVSRPPNAAADCWNDIGVEGNNSCPELAQFGHCRNCPVYADAGTSFFDRNIPEDYRLDWTDILRRKKEVYQTGTTSIIVFGIADERLALPTAMLREVIDFRSVHHVPRRSGSVLLGLVNVRGEIQLCVSLAGLFGIESAELEAERRSADHSAKRMIVAERSGEVWVFPVDRVHGSHRVLNSNIVSPPVTVERSASRFTRGVVQLENMPVGLLDIEAIFAMLRKGIA